MKPLKIQRLAELQHVKLTTTAAAALLRVSEKTLGQWVAQGYIEKTGRGEFELISLVQGALREAREARKRLSHTAALSKVQEARAREVELRVAQRERELIPRDDTVEFHGAMIGRVLQELSALPARCSSVDRAERVRVEDGVRICRENIANFAAELCQKFQEGREG